MEGNAGDYSGEALGKLDRSRWQRIGPIATLLLLSPFIAELLSGATRVSTAYVLVPEIMTWGCGALIIRELVRRWHGGRNSLVLLAPAIAIAEEIIIQQTSLAPLVWVHSARIYGRFVGVNWVWLLAMIVYESVTVVLLPVQLTELVFRARRNQPWLSTRGLLIAAIVFFSGALLAWFAWTQNYRTRILHLPAYHPPVAYLVLGFSAIGLLAFAAFEQRKSMPPPRAANFRRSPWLVGIAAFILAYPWDFMIALNFNIAPHLPPWIPLAGGTVYVIALFLLVRHFSAGSGWNDRHRFALCAGTAAAVASWGTENVWHGLRMDWIGQLIFVAASIFLFIRLARVLAAGCVLEEGSSRGASERN